jgi:hypothetical protein
MQRPAPHEGQSTHGVFDLVAFAVAPVRETSQRPRVIPVHIDRVRGGIRIASRSPPQGQ